VHKDTRVKTAHKFDVVFKSKPIRGKVSNNGVRINNHHVKPTLPTPRPPPSIRAYFPNFPIAATTFHLTQAARTAGVTVIKCARKTFRNTNIATGGWFLWAPHDTNKPDTIKFGDEHFAFHLENPRAHELPGNSTYRTTKGNCGETNRRMGTRLYAGNETEEKAHSTNSSDNRTTALSVTFRDHATAHKTNMTFGYHSFLDADIYTSSMFGEGGYDNTERTYNLCKKHR